MNNIMAEGGQVTLLGLLVVFVCLILIIVLITVLSLIMRERKKPEPAPVKKFEEEMHKPMPVVPVVDVQNDELIAVLTAAAAAYMAEEQAQAQQEETLSGLVVRPYRRQGQNRAWARAGRDAQIYNKF